MSVLNDEQNLLSGFVKTLRAHPDHPALRVDGQLISYATLAARAQAVAEAIVALEERRAPTVAVYADRSADGFAGILGILASGRGYVPLNPKFPIERCRSVLERAESEVLVVPRTSLAKLDPLLLDMERSPKIVLFEDSEAGFLKSRNTKYQFAVVAPHGSAEFGAHAQTVAPETIAYLLFTSGSTGVPKGVAVRHRNVAPYIDYVVDRYDYSAEAQVSQAFDLTFDLSVHDMFACWTGGGCLNVLPDTALLAPTKFIREHALTHWFSVPSVVAFMARLGTIEPDCFPSLRYSLFCGEALPEAAAQSWQAAAPQSIVENLYGPTEATIAITHYRWDPEISPAECRNGIVPIGRPFSGQGVRIVDHDGGTLGPGEEGELWLNGSQVTDGYWHDPDTTRQNFVTDIDAKNSVWYRTGDLAVENQDGCVAFLGRIDSQIKVRGHRVELQEIEHVIRQTAGTAQVLALGWPVRDNTAEAIVVFVFGANDIEQSKIHSACKKSLPDYMVPRKIYFRDDDPPLNVNGKLDRRKLIACLENQEN